MSSALLDALVTFGRLTRPQREDALRVAAERSIDPVDAVVNVLGYVDLASVRAVGLSAAGAEWTDDLALVPADPDAVRLLNSQQARKWRVVPLRFDGDTLVVAATADTASRSEVRDNLLAAIGNRSIKWLIASVPDLSAKLDTTFRAEAELASLVESVTLGDGNVGEYATRFVKLILDQAVIDRASDIHVEPNEREVAVRVRIDGVLVDKPVASKAMQDAVINQLKIAAELDIAERRTPQDGRLSHTYGDRRVDFRVAVLPTVWGEKVVLRILDNSAARMSLREFGLTETNQRRFRQSFTKPNGLVLLTGPTGSGKSTTLYATLNELNRPDINIVTVEDPVEYRLPRINQIQVSSKMSFASALRTILRADPDVILVGEMRDHETAQIAIEAAMTGHLVLSTLHTNSAPEAPARLIEMGIDPFRVAEVTECVVSQRLVRVLCECKQPTSPPDDELAALQFQVPPGTQPTFFMPHGCPKCAGTGYRGRLAIQEVMATTPEIRHAIFTKQDAGTIAGLAAAAGMTSLRQDGWVKVAAGLTSISEVLRVAA